MSDVQTTEKTSKRWKIMTLTAVAMLVICVVMTCAGCAGGPVLLGDAGQPSDAAVVGTLLYTGLQGCLAIGGVVMLIWARIGAYWENG